MKGAPRPFSSPVLLVLLLAWWAPAGAAPLSPGEVPGPLRPWIGWALHGHERARCPVLFDAGASEVGAARVCVWGGELELGVDDDGGRFRQPVQVHARGWVELPGGPGAWPDPVRVDGEPVTVGDRSGRPAVWLEAGEHAVDGDFRWSRLPPSLQLPRQAGLLEVRLRGERVPFPDRDPGNRLWFSRPAGAAPPRQAPGNAVQVDVSRRLVDEVPFQVVTRVELRVAGVARELLLGRALLEGFVPLSLHSELPARLEPDGRIRLQVRAGSWSVTLVARRHGPVAELAAPSQPSEPWAEQEVWVFDARTALRVVELHGLRQVDPRQTRLPEQWRQLPAYLVRPGDRLRIETRRRGDPEPEPDQLSLERRLWLDFDGGGYSFSDSIRGRVTRGWRLDAGPGLVLGRVMVNGRPAFITEEDGRVGVEVRQGQLRLAAEGRLAQGAEIPAAGWHQDFRRVSAMLAIPPGWRLLTATGVDGVSPSWLGGWTLFDLFLVLIIAAVVWRLWGWRWGLVALLGLVLVWHEPGAPRQVWLHVLAPAALLRVLPEGRFRLAARLYRSLALVALVVVAVPFAVSQVRLALYPQVERPYQRQQQAVPGAPVARTAVPAADEAGVAAPAPSVERPAPPSQAARKRGPASRAAPPSEGGVPALALVDPDASVQTGPGLPRWQWQRVTLTWNGPVQTDERLRLVLLSPLVVVLLRLLAVLGVAALVVRLLERRPRMPAPPAATAAGLMVAVLAAAGVPRDAQAQLPDAALLDTLRDRLLEAPACVPRCAQSPHLALEASPDVLRMTWLVHALHEVAVPLPGGREQWLPTSVLVDGEPAAGTRLRGDGELWLRLAPGRHVVRLSGALPPRDRVALALGLAPRRVAARLQGWTLRGVRPDGSPEGALQLERVQAAVETRAEGLRPAALPPFVRVERTLRLGLEWGVSTRVRRVSPAGAAVALTVPLLPGESVTTEGVQVEAGGVQVSLAPEASQARWESVLAPTSPLTLTAPDDSRWTEVWRLEASPIWHVAIEGIPVVHHQSAGRWLPEWRPWPGEAVTLRVTRPKGVAGRTLTLEASHLALAPGSRATEATLTLSLRTSQGARHPLTLPEGATLQEVSLDGRSQPLRPDGRVLTLPLDPGSHEARIVWRAAGGTRAVYRTPVVGLGVESVNAGLQIAVPPERWVLFAGGPVLGPAVLFWDLLAVLLVVALGLARTGRTPLGVVQWILLGVGLSQISVWLAVGVVAWLFALDARGRLAEPQSLARWKFNLMQVGLALLTLAALGVLFHAVQQGLLGRPEMQIAGNGSNAAMLNWFADRIAEALPEAWMLSVPIWVYRSIMLAWALWLAFALVGWLRWGFGCFASGGLWRTIVFRRPRSSAPVAED